MLPVLQQTCLLLRASLPKVSGNGKDLISPTQQTVQTRMKRMRSSRRAWQTRPPLKQQSDWPKP